MKKLYLFMLLGIFLLSMVSAQTTWGTIKQGDCINIGTICPLDNCNETTIVSIKFPNSTNAVSNAQATHNGDQWNYSFCDTLELGIYTVYGNSTNSTQTEKFIGDFEITPSGSSGSSNILFYIIILILGYVLNLLGFFNRNAYITILGGIILLFVGLFMIQNGIIIFRNNLTLVISYVTMFWGLGSSLWAAIEEIQDNF